MYLISILHRCQIEIRFFHHLSILHLSGLHPAKLKVVTHMKNVDVAENRYNVPTIMLLFAEHGKALTNDLAEKMLLLVHVNKRKV